MPCDMLRSIEFQYDRRHAAGYLSLEPISDLEPSQLNIESRRRGMKEVDMKGMNLSCTCSFVALIPSLSQISTRK